MSREQDDLLRTLAILGLSVLGGAYLSRKAIQLLSRWIAYPILTDKLDENVWEQVVLGRRQGLFRVIETELRAHGGSPIKRPMGARRFAYWRKVFFNSCQLATLPSPTLCEVDTTVTIGPGARRPLTLAIPILAAGMAYGFALSERFKLAIARGTSAVGTATNTGCGPWLPPERKAAKHLILQYPRANWSREEAVLRQADAIEIQFGQGANAGLGAVLKPEEMNPVLKRHLPRHPGDNVAIHTRMEGVKTTRDLEALITRLRRVTRGVPIGVKYAAGKYLEADLAIAIEAGADFVSVDGGEAGTHGSTPTLEDDFGLPTFIAVARACRFWEENHLKGKVSLLAGGGFTTPGECLKALAMGVDAVSMGTAILIATTHSQILKTLPYEPPTQLSYQDGKYKDAFDVEQGAKSLANFLTATIGEMKEAVRALGKRAIRDVSKRDMFTIDKNVAEIAGLDLAFHPAGTPRLVGVASCPSETPVL